MNYLYKTSKIIAAPLLLVTLASCEKEYTPVDYACDAAWMTTETNKHPKEYRMNLGSAISFMDASIGTISHQWIIEDGSEFMVDDFDIKNKDFVSQIDPTKGLTSKNVVESVYFGKVGMTKVTLVNSFYEWVKAHDANPVEAILGDNEWILTKEFAVDVYDVLKPSFKITHGETEITVGEDDDVKIEDKSTWKVIELGLGEKIRFEDLTTTDRPSGAKWDVPNSIQTSQSANYDPTDGSDPDSKIVEFSFNKMSPDAGFSGFGLTSQRIVPAMNVKKLIPVIVKIVASTEEFRVNTNEITLDPNNSNTIQLTANGPFGVCGANASSAFTVTVDLYGTTPTVIPVEKVEASAGGNKLNIVLTDKVYAGETVRIAYDGQGDIYSIDNRKLFDFAEITLPAVTGGSVLDPIINSFEKPQTAGFATIGWATLGGTFVTDGFLGVVDRPGGAIGVNQKAVKFDIKSNAHKAPYYITHAVAEEIPAGNYKLKLSVLLEAEGTGNWDKLIQIKTVPGATVIANMQLEAEDLGKWKTFEIDYNHKNTSTDKKIQIVIGKGTTETSGTIFYVDDLELVPVRPAAN